MDLKILDILRGREQSSLDILDKFIEQVKENVASGYYNIGNEQCAMRHAPISLKQKARK